MAYGASKKEKEGKKKEKNEQTKKKICDYVVGKKILWVHFAFKL